MSFLCKLERLTFFSMTVSIASAVIKTSDPTCAACASTEAKIAESIMAELKDIVVPAGRPEVGDDILAARGSP